MDINHVYRRFPTHQSCIERLEQIRWKCGTVCPYCKSISATPVLKELRHHCNKCNTSFSVTVGTIFHRTKLDLQKWFLAISLDSSSKSKVASRQLGREIMVSKDTAWRMLIRIRRTNIENSNLLKDILRDDENHGSGEK